MNTQIIIEPGKQVSWEEFNSTKLNSIALDGYVTDGPKWDETKLNANFDHHNGVVREATMSTAMQIYFAIKGGLMERYENSTLNIYINDVDQDTTMAIWLIKNYKLFTGTNSVPHVNRIMSLNDKMDITGGAFPISINDNVYFQHCWIFQPYTELRTSGNIAKGDKQVFENCLEAIMSRLDKLLMGMAGEYKPKADYQILKSTDDLIVIDETLGGIEARHYLFAHDMIKKSYLSIIAKKDDGSFVYTIGKKSRYIKLPLKEIFSKLNELEETLNGSNCWGGSDIIGGSPRATGSRLSWQTISDTIESCLRF
jgi:hypothetical protein